MKPEQYYLDLINKVYDETRKLYLEEGNDEDYFDFGVEIHNYNDVEEEMIVGYYIMYYPEDPLGMWLENKSYSKLVFPTDQGVTELLQRLFG